MPRTDTLDIVGADVTLWLAGPNAPEKRAETTSKEDGSFDLAIGGGIGLAGVLYLIAKGGEARAQAANDAAASAVNVRAPHLIVSAPRSAFPG